MLTRKKSTFRTAIASATAISGLLISGCATAPASHDAISKEARITSVTKTQAALQALAPPGNKVTVAVYEFEDKTGQFKPTEAGQTLSRAVSQGGDELLIKALQDAGNRSWFTIIERSNLNNLLKERQIITEMRSRYLGEKTINSKALPPLLFAGVIFEGGIVGFDTNTATGGVAARYLGIGGQTDYRQNVVTVHLRAVSVKTGEVLASVTTEKTIASVGVSANAFRFVTFDNLLEADAGFTSNEPGLLALRQAIEKSVYALVMEGSEIGLWNFRDKAAGLALLHEYKYERDGEYPAQTSYVQSPQRTQTAVNQLGQSQQARKQPARKMARTKPAPKPAQMTQKSKTPTVKAVPAVPVKMAVATPPPSTVKVQAAPVTPVQVQPVPNRVVAKSQPQQTVVLSAPQPRYQTFSAPVDTVKAQAVRQGIVTPVNAAAQQPTTNAFTITDSDVVLYAPAETDITASQSENLDDETSAATAPRAENSSARDRTVNKILQSLATETRNTGSLP